MSTPSWLPPSSTTTPEDDFFDYHRYYSTDAPSTSSSSSTPSLSSGASGRSSPDYHPGTPPSTSEFYGDSSPASQGRRSRRVENPEKTQKVREDGACLRCRLRKVNCEPGVCAACVKFCPQAANVACMHIGPADLGTVSGLLMGLPGTRHRTSEYRQHDFTICASLDGLAEITLGVTQYIYADGTLQLFLDPNYAGRIPGDLSSWAAQAMVAESQGQGNGFLYAVHSFLIMYLGCGEMMPKSDFAALVHQFITMWRIFRTPAFTYEDGCAHPELDSQIRINAFRMMKSAEQRIWDEMEICLSYQGKNKGFNEANAKAVLFAGLWELMVVYNEIVKYAAMGSPVVESANPHQLVATAYRMYTALLVFYTGQFYMPKTLEPQLDTSVLPVLPAMRDALHSAMDTMLSMRKAYLELFTIASETNPSDPDALLYTLIIKHEQAKLLKARSRKKKGGVAVPLVVPDCDIEMNM